MRCAFKELFEYWRPAVLQHEDVGEEQATGSCFVVEICETTNIGSSERCGVVLEETSVGEDGLRGSDVECCKRQRKRQVNGSAKAEAAVRRQTQ